MTFSTTVVTQRFGELAGDLTASAGDARAAFVFLPGLTFDRTMWQPTLQSLHTVDPGRTTLALDMPGEGESVGTFRGLETAMEQLHSAIIAAGIEVPVIVGHSGSAIGAMFYALKYPVRGIVNVDALLDTTDFSARLRALEPQLRNGGLAAIWEDLFASLHPERSGPAGEAMLRATSRPRLEVMLGYWAPVLATPPTAETDLADAFRRSRVHRPIITGVHTALVRWRPKCSPLPLILPAVGPAPSAPGQRGGWNYDCTAVSNLVRTGIRSRTSRNFVAPSPCRHAR